MSLRRPSGCTAWVLSFATLSFLSACGGDETKGDDDADAETGGMPVGGGATATGGGAGRGGVSSNGGTSGSGLTAGRGGSNDTGGAASRGGGPATGGTSPNAGRAGATTGGGGATEPPDSIDGKSPYELECHGDTAMCKDPTSLLCLGLRVGTEVLGYGCANECQSDAHCSEVPASTGATAGCIDFVNKKYCLLVCKNGDEQASCPTGMDCYVYEGTTRGYCLWR